MKRIAIFCDGTWNGFEGDHPTNVKLLAFAAGQKTSAGQEVHYFKGVGVPEGGSWLERLNEKLSGGAMGWGLDKKIALAYVALANAYRPGDQVHVFGFSRGAYTARSLVGLIRYSGIPARTDDATIEACFANYRTQDPDAALPAGRALADSDKNLAFRTAHSPLVATSAFEQARRAAAGTDLPLFNVAYLGIWDTVGALGIPSHWGLPARLLNRKYRFHNTDLSSMVRTARHAISIDERRRHFEPTLWGNLADLRAGGGDYHQEWFAGDHGSVGGGGDITDLSALALFWIAQGARKAGLVFDAPLIAMATAACNPFGPLRNTSAARTVTDKILHLTARSRKGPAAANDVSDPAKRRWRMVADYRPDPLRPLAGDLGQIDVAGLLDDRWAGTIL